MPLYIHPSKGVVAVAVCDRCSFKVPYTELRADSNSLGLRVCRSCCDAKDPYTKPARKAENTTLRYPRPDEPLHDAAESDKVGTEYLDDINFPPEIST